MPALAHAQVPDARVQAIPEYVSVRAGQVFRVAVRLVVPAGWHIGWINPGAGGLATTITWHPPAGVTAGNTEWPYPETDDAAGAVSNVYRGSLVVFSSFTAQPGSGRIVRLSADLDYGLCREECVRQHRTVAVSVRIGSVGSARTAAWSDVALAERALPLRLSANAVDARSEGDSVVVKLVRLPAAPAPGSWVMFFPLAAGKTSIVVRSRGVADGIELSLPRAVVTGAPRGEVSGVLVAAHPPGAAPTVRPLLLHVPLAR
jgi:thiol:disulfide interchange protein DsbD